MFYRTLCSISSVFRHMPNMVWKVIFLLFVLSNDTFVSICSASRINCPLLLNIFTSLLFSSKFTTAIALCHFLYNFDLTKGPLKSPQKGSVKNADQSPQQIGFRSSIGGCVCRGVMSRCDRPRRAYFSSSISVSDTAEIRFPSLNSQVSIEPAVIPQKGHKSSPFFQELDQGSVLTQRFPFSNFMRREWRNKMKSWKHCSMTTKAVC